MFSESQSSALELLVVCSNAARVAGRVVDVDDALRQVHFLLQDHTKLIEASLELLDHERKSSVQMIEDDAGDRHFWRVQGSKEQDYLCLTRHCSCQSFQQLLKVSSDSQPILCKHLLAIKLAVILDMVDRVKLPLDQFVERMCQAVQGAQGLAASVPSTGRFNSSYAPTFKPY